MGRRRINGGPCSKRGCDRPTMGKGLCKRHYQQEWRVRQKALAKRAKAKTVPSDHVADVPPRMHGQYLTYRAPHNCRCQPCKDAHSAYMRWYRLQRKSGPILVSAASTKHRLRQLHKDGWSMLTVGAATGLSEHGLDSVLNGKSTKVSARVKESIGGLMLSDLMAANRGTLPAQPYIQMTNELIAAGFQKTYIRETIRSSDWFTKPRKRIWPTTAKRVKALHDEAWRNNTNNFRRHCTCIQVAEPETIRNTEAQRALRERRTA